MSAPDLADDARFVRGRELFAVGRYWDAHEAWEALWRDERDEPSRLLLQGLIQLAAALYKLVERGDVAACERITARGTAKLARLPDVVRGVDVKAFRAAAQRVVDVRGAGQQAALGLHRRSNAHMDKNETGSRGQGADDEGSGLVLNVERVGPAAREPARATGKDGPGRDADGTDGGSKPGRDADGTDGGSKPGRDADGTDGGDQPPARDADGTDGGSKPGRDADGTDGGSKPGRDADGTDGGDRRPARDADGTDGGSKPA